MFQSKITSYTVLENNYPCDVLIVDNEYKPILQGEVPLFNVRIRVVINCIMTEFSLHMCFMKKQHLCQVAFRLHS